MMPSPDPEGSAKHSSSSGTRHSSRLQAQKQFDKPLVGTNSDPSPEPEQATSTETAGADTNGSSSKRRKQNNGTATGGGSGDATWHSPRLRKRRRIGIALLEDDTDPSPEPEQATSTGNANVPQRSNSYDQPPSAEHQIAGSPQHSPDDQPQVQGDNNREQLANDAHTSKLLNGQMVPHVTGTCTLFAEEPLGLALEASSPTTANSSSSSTSTQQLGSQSDVSILNEPQQLITPYTEDTVNSLATSQDPKQQQTHGALPTTAPYATASQNRGPHRPPYQESTVELGYIINPKRTVERKAWFQRQNASKSKDAHFYGRLFVNSARELYFVQFQAEMGVQHIAWLVDRDEHRLRVAEGAYRAALKRSPRLGGHQFYDRCDGAWRVVDLHLDMG